MDNNISEKTEETDIKRKYWTPFLVYRIAFGIFCAILCIRQIQKICQIYFAYEVSTLVYYENVLSVTVPAMTLCMHKTYLFRADRKATLGVNITDKQLEDHLNSKTIAEQLKDLYSAEDFFGKDCLIMRPNIMNNTEDYVQCSQISTIRTSVDYHNICFTLFSQFDGEPSNRYTFDFDVSIKNYFLEIISFKVNLKVSEIHFFIHSRGVRISDSFDYNHIKLLYELGTKSCIKYHITEIHLLPKPYITDCVDYNGRGYHSVIDCILQCKIVALKKLYKGWPGNYLSYNATDDKMEDILSKMEDNSSLDLKLGKECRKMCGHNSDCFKEYFNFFEVKLQNNSETGFMVNIFAPDFPNLMYTSSPKMELEEMLCFVASMVGVWFGFSFIACSERLIHGVTLLANFVHNYNQTKNVNSFLTLNNNYYGKGFDRRVRGYASNHHKSVFNFNRY